MPNVLPHLYYELIIVVRTHPKDDVLTGAGLNSASPSEVI